MVHEQYDAFDLISIRAPARGATLPVASVEELQPISIRAPARGATYNKDWDEYVYIFQSALPRGERLYISLMLRGIMYFNPRSREGSDRSKTVAAIIKYQFQSALPRGERQDCS